MVRRWQEGGGLVNGSDLITEGTASATDAAPEPYSSWDSVPWDKVEAHVSKLQNRIARATREGRVEEARKAQRQLVASFDAKLLAEQRAAGMKIVSLENAAVAGGLGEAIGADVKFGWPDVFIPHGTQAELERRYGLEVDAIVAALKPLTTNH
jgi:hypothetical protein